MNYLIMCIGNKEGGDDAIGPFIYNLLKNDQSNAFGLLNCETYPENFTSKIKEISPKKLVIIDAIEMYLKPGEIRIVPKERIGVMHISTHGIPISILINYLEQYVKCIYLVGIQPKVMKGDISDEIKKSGYKLVEILKNDNIEQIKKLI